MQVDSEAFHSEHQPTRNNNPERIRKYTKVGELERTPLHMT
jgi:hypothetical protein